MAHAGHVPQTRSTRIDRRVQILHVYRPLSITDLGWLGARPVRQAELRPSSRGDPDMIWTSYSTSFSILCTLVQFQPTSGPNHAIVATM